MGYTKIKLNGESLKYCCPDILCQIPSTFDKKERDLVRVFMTRDIMYVLSAQIILAAEKNGNYAEIIENSRTIEYSLREYDPKLEVIIQTLVAEQNKINGGKK